MTFDLLIPTGSGFLYAITIIPEGLHEVAAVTVDDDLGEETIVLDETANGEEDPNPEMATNASELVEHPVTLPNLTRQLVHYRMCHVNQRDAEKAAKYLGYGLYKPRSPTDPVLPMEQHVKHIVMCEFCQLSRVKRHGVSKNSSHIPSTFPNQRIFLDISTIREAGGFPLKRGVCIGIVDEYGKYGMVIFVEKKGELPQVLCQLFSKWKQQKRPVQIVRCDNAGENKAFKKMAMTIQ
jgi:hypothetical protein